jgi:hypothetical protein
MVALYAEEDARAWTHKTLRAREHQSAFCEEGAMLVWLRARTKKGESLAGSHTVVLAVPKEPLYCGGGTS